GSFRAPVSFGSVCCFLMVAAGDFNRDGRLDFAAPNPENNLNVISILLQVSVVSLSKTSLQFGGRVVGTRSLFQTVTLTAGFDPLTISSIVITGNDPHDFSQANNCGSNLAAGAQCTILVSFDPTQTGPRTASVTITDNAANSPQIVALSGTGEISGPDA